MSKLIDIMNAPWAITPAMLHEIRGIYETHLRGEKIDITAIEAHLGRSLNNETKDYEVVNGVAVISAVGAIAKRMNLFSKISGGVSTEMLGNQIMHAIEDNEVKAIILEIDSPGGTVDGTFDLSNKIFEMRGNKPIVAFSNGLMASAAYAIGSAADEIYISGQTTMVGSIGVVSTHVDISQAEQKFGQKTTEITAGKYKRIASQYEPLSAEGRADIQASVDYLYSVFVEQVATFRAVPVSTVLDDMADGRMFIGQQAIDAGLVDGVSSLDELIADLSMGLMPSSKQTRAGAAHNLNDTEHKGNEISFDDSTSNLLVKIEDNLNKSDLKLKGENIMSENNQEITTGYVSEHYPEVAEAFRAEGSEDARAEGANEERERIQAVLNVSMVGHEKLIQRLAFDGKTTGPEAAVQVINAEKEIKGKVISNIENDAAKLNSVNASTGEEPQTAELSNLPVEERCEAKWGQIANLRAEFNDNYDAYLAYEKQAEKGKVRVLGQNK